MSDGTTFMKILLLHVTAAVCSPYRREPPLEAAVRWRADLAVAAGKSQAVGEAFQPARSVEQAWCGAQEKTVEIGGRVNRESQVQIEMP
jgi:hypothetical protein